MAESLGGYDAMFSIELIEEFTCSVCLKAFRNPYQLECGHQYCWSCLDEWRKTQGENSACPQDRVKINMEKVFADRNLERKILTLPVNCNNLDDQCGWSGNLKELEDHLQKCEYEKRYCQNDCCKEFMQKRYLSDHMSLECIFRVTKCLHCNGNYIKKDEEDHLALCTRLPIECENNCGNQIPRDEIEGHMKDSCSHSLVKCTYVDVGCTFMCKRMNLENHENDAVKRHLEFAMQKIIETKTILENKPETMGIGYAHNTMTAFYVLPITNYSSQLEQSRTTNKPIQSPPLITSEHGYKLRFFVYLNGYGKGKGTHLSLGIVIMRGRIDTLLSWPFRYECKFALFTKCRIQQKTPDDCNTGALVKPDTDQNALFGCPTLITHEDITRNGFVVDDTIFAKITIWGLPCEIL